MKRSRIRPVSRRRARRDAGYEAARRQVHDRAEGFCEAFVTRDCTGYCEQVHHKAGRGGPDPHRLDNLVGCCEPCHMWIHAHPAEARDLGLMVSRLAVRP